MLRLLLLFWALALLNPAPVSAQEAETAVVVEVRDLATGTDERYQLYGASHALVIGIDDYTGGWPKLDNAIKDAEEVAAALQAGGFSVHLVLDADSAALREELRRFFAIKGADPEARLFVWFAGHGHTEFGEGYLVPKDAPLPGNPEFQFHALHMGDVGAMVKIARAKHALVVFDSCFAGTIFSAQRSRPPAAITKVVTQPVRQFLTSGDADQQVSDDGTFRRLFIDSITGQEPADLNGDGYLTGSELGLHLEDRITNLTNAAQTPRAGKLRDIRFDRGDFVFLLPQARIRIAAAAATAEPDQESRGEAALSDALAVELAFWDSVKDSSAAGDYAAYLESYPEGRFVPLAEARLRALDAPPPRSEEVVAENEPEPAEPQSEPQSEPQTAAAGKQTAARTMDQGKMGQGEMSHGGRLAGYLRDREPALGQALLAYEDLGRVVFLPSLDRTSAAIKILRKAALGEAGARAFVELGFMLTTGYGSVVGADVFALEWAGGGYRVVAHGETARLGLAAIR